MAQTPPGGSEWVVNWTTAYVSESRVLVLRLPQTAGADQVFGLEVDPAEAVQVLEQLEVLAGHDLAYLRLMPRKVGKVHLQVRGLGVAGHLLLEVRSGKEVASLPRIVNPLPGAWLWGEVCLGARVAGERPSKVKLLCNWNGLLESDQYEKIDGLWRLRFLLQTEKLPPGPAQLQLRVEYKGGRVQESEVLPVTIARPEAGEVRAYETEALARAVLPKNLPDRRQPRVASDRRASGGAYTMHVSPDPYARLPLESKSKDGDWYQVVVRARGSHAAAAWPTLAVILDRGVQVLRTTTPLLSEDWHRVALGRPFPLAKGKHLVGVRFMNDRYVPGVLDRNLDLDRIELLKVKPGAGRQKVELHLANRLAGRAVHGAFSVQAWLLREGKEKTPPPKTSLYVNGKRLSSQYSERPRFVVGTQALSEGENYLQLGTALPSGKKIWTMPHTFYWRGKGSRTDGLWRFTVSMPSWKGSATKTRGYEKNAVDGHVYCMSSNSEAWLELPEELEGTFDLAAHVRGKSYRGAAEARVSLGEKELKVVKASTSWKSHGVSRIKLEKGQKRLGLAFINDLHDEGEGDRNLYFSAFELRAVDPQPDQEGPQVRIHYPKAGVKIYLSDAVVFDVTDPSGLRDVQVLVDGKALPGAYQAMANRVDSRVCLLFTDRRLEPGPHTLSIVAHDRFGKRTTSEPIEVELSKDPEASPFARAAHFLNRFGYGPEPRWLGQVLLASPSKILEQALAKAPESLVLYAAEKRFPDGRSHYHVSRRVLDHARRSANPIRTRLALFWENHFSTWIRKVGAEAEWQEHLCFQAVASARFGRVLRASAHSPAMMRYLDNLQSYAGRINESYAREIMELHTLGVAGGYTQKDVEALTRVLTGWSVTSDAGQQKFAFLAGLHDRSAQTVAGYRVRAVPEDASGEKARELAWDRGEAMLEMLLAHPSTARSLAGKLVAHYVAHPAPEPLVAEVARTYLQTDGDVVAMLERILQSQAFARASPGGKGADPLEYGLRLCRLGGWDDPWELGKMLEAVQRLPMERSTPDGYPETAAAWFDSSSMLQRRRFAEQAAGSIRWRLFQGPWRSNWAMQSPNWNQGLIDHLALRLFGRRLSQSSNETALSVMAKSKGDVNERVGLAISILGQLPEAHMH